MADANEIRAPDSIEVADHHIDIANRLMDVSSIQIDYLASRYLANPPAGSASGQFANRLTNTALRQVSVSNQLVRMAVDDSANRTRTLPEHVADRLVDISLRQVDASLRLPQPLDSRQVALVNQSAVGSANRTASVAIEAASRGPETAQHLRIEAVPDPVEVPIRQIEAVNRPIEEGILPAAANQLVLYPQPAENAVVPNNLAAGAVVHLGEGGTLPAEANQLVLYPQPAENAVVQLGAAGAVSPDEDDDYYENDFEYPEMPQTPPDLVIKGVDCEIELHKNLLVEVSPFFKSMFGFEVFLEYNQREINLTEGPQFLEILKAVVYNQRLRMHSDNVITAMMATTKYFLPTTRIFVTLYVKKSITASNCLRYWHYTNKFQYRELNGEVFNFCAAHFRELRDDLRVWVSPQQMQAFILSDYLNVRNEEELLDILHCCYSLSELTELLNLTRVELLARGTLLQLLRTPWAAGLSIRIREAIHQQTQLPSVHRANNQRRHRYRKRRPVFLAIGGNAGDNGVVHHSMECFVEGDVTWRSSIPERVRHGQPPRVSLVLPTLLNQATNAAVAYTDDTVYIIGGKDGGAYGKGCLQYSVKDNSWRALKAQLPRICQGHAAAMCEGRIYISGGINAQDFFCLDPIQSKAWKKEKELPQIRSFHCSLGAYGFVYVMGGFVDNDHSCPTRSVLRFDPMAQLWEAVPDMLSPRAHMAVAVLGHEIFVFGGDDALNEYRSCEKFNIITRKWTNICDMSQTRSRFTAVPLGNLIFCYGGQSNDNAVTSCDAYNPRTDQWHSRNPMRIPRRDHGAAVVYLPEEDPEAA